jgi:hypothetical protein
VGPRFMRRALSEWRLLAKVIPWVSAGDHQ